MIIDDQMQHEVVEPAHRGLAARSTFIKDAMGVNASVVTDGKRGRVDEADASTLTHQRIKIRHQRHQDGRHQLDKVLIAHQRWKFVVQMTLDVLDEVGFEVTIVGVVKQNKDRHELDFGAVGSYVCAVAVPSSAVPATIEAQTAAKNRLQNKRVRVYS